MSGTITLGGKTLASHSNDTDALSLNEDVTIPLANVSNLKIPGLLAFFQGYKSTSSTTTFTLDGSSIYTVAVAGRNYGGGVYYATRLSFDIDSSNGTISNKLDVWGDQLNESFDNNTKILTITNDSGNEIFYIFIYYGPIARGT